MKIVFHCLCIKISLSIIDVELAGRAGNYHGEDDLDKRANES